MFDLSGKNALVTGASRGIGRAIALLLAEQGANVAVHFHQNEEAAREVAAHIENLGRKTAILGADARDFTAFSALWKRAEDELGPLQILVNNAGALRRAPLGLVSESSWDEMLDANLKSAFALSKSAARSFARQKTGRIVNVASQAGQTGEALAAPYSAAKAGLIGLTKAAARELAPYGATCNALAPGFIETDLVAETKPATREAQEKLIPLGRFGTPTEVAALCLFLVSDEAAYVTGQIFAPDGGLRM